METAHRTELEWAEVCSGIKLKKREMVLVWIFLPGGKGEGKIILLQKAE